MHQSNNLLECCSSCSSKKLYSPIRLLSFALLYSISFAITCSPQPVLHTPVSISASWVATILYVLYGLWGWSQTAGHCSPPAASKQSAGQRQILAAAFAASLNLCPVYRPPQIHKSHYYNHQVYMLHFYPLHIHLPRSTGPINISISIFAAPAYPLPRLNTHTTLHLPYISTSPDPLVYH